jgi:hypothetical protein
VVVIGGLLCLAYGTLYHKIRQREFEVGLVYGQSRGFSRSVPGKQAGNDLSGLVTFTFEDNGIVRFPIITSANEDGGYK